MNVIGIICEYNPFHNGHLYQINKVKEKYKDSIIIACMSTSFSQRGDISILNKFDKTALAIENGIDLVIELPYIYTVQSADTFAKYSVLLLNNLKIDTLVFGTERDDISDLVNAAKEQINNKEYDTLVKRFMGDGNNYPTSLNMALKALKITAIDEPNDLLALSYIKEIIRNNYNIKYENIKRTNDYHDIESNSEVVSASNIRNSVINNKDFKHQVPLNVYNVLKSKTLSIDKYFELLKYKIISEDNLTKYVEIEEGIDKRIKKYINISNNLEELIQNIKTKRYTYNKISRILNHILCSYTKDENVKTLEYIRILGFNSRGQKYLNSIKKGISLHILNSYDTKFIALNVEKRITDIYSLIQEDISDIEIKNKPININ